MPQNKINDIQKQALQYVENTGGHATIDNFIYDWEPVGRMLWRDLQSVDAIEMNNEGKIILTLKGKKILATK